MRSVFNVGGPVVVWLLVLFLLLAFIWFLWERWEVSYIRTKIIDRHTLDRITMAVQSEEEEVQILHWRKFRNTTVLEHGCWYVFRLKNSSFIVEQYDEELNWRFYVPHTDYVTAFAKIENP